MYCNWIACVAFPIPTSWSYMVFFHFRATDVDYHLKACSFLYVYITWRTNCRLLQSLQIPSDIGYVCTRACTKMSILVMIAIHIHLYIVFTAIIYTPAVGRVRPLWLKHIFVFVQPRPSTFELYLPERLKEATMLIRHNWCPIQWHRGKRFSLRQLRFRQSPQRNRGES